VFAPGIHPTAVIGKNVTLGEGVSIQPHVVIEEGTTIGAGTVIGAQSYLGHGVVVGAGCVFYPRVTVGYRCEVGNRVALHSGVVLGADGFGYEFQNGAHQKIPQQGVVIVEDDVEIGANTTIDRARFGRTLVGQGSKLDNLVQVGHNVVIGKHVIVCGQAGISGSSKVGSYAMIGGQAGLAGHIEVGDKIMIGGQSGVTKSLEGGQLYIGTPAQPIRQYQRQLALVAQIARLKERIAALEQKLGEK
jgi:UDP-3-O-[3-hydroxymyristoyl] glucosamine N-acyltransferase